ncbi:MAG: hypothetical protein JO199_10995, partial [Candidatus Eremiobacteraeota bacterium]|nr:hypothetical protein [Candidatus Eremiobacteraeota bacterium]
MIVVNDSEMIALAASVATIDHVSAAAGAGAVTEQLNPVPKSPDFVEQAAPLVGTVKSNAFVPSHAKSSFVVEPFTAVSEKQIL